jgi:hypothetical protein
VVEEDITRANVWGQRFVTALRIIGNQSAEWRMRILGIDLYSNELAANGDRQLEIRKCANAVAGDRADLNF